MIDLGDEQDNLDDEQYNDYDRSWLNWGVARMHCTSIQVMQSFSSKMIGDSDDDICRSGGIGLM